MHRLETHVHVPRVMGGFQGEFSAEATRVERERFREFNTEVVHDQRNSRTRIVRSSLFILTFVPYFIMLDTFRQDNYSATVMLDSIRILSGCSEGAYRTPVPFV